MIIATCRVNAIRSQNPAPNHCAASKTDAPAATLAAKTTTTAIRASAKASGNQRSNQSARRSPSRASDALAGVSSTCGICGSVPLPLALVLQDMAPLYTMANLGYVGLGMMGGRMAARLLDQGHGAVLLLVSETAGV